jgi:hypothetical protein
MKSAGRSWAPGEVDGGRSESDSQDAEFASYKVRSYVTHISIHIEVKSIQRSLA